jgi:hypothetical protein
MPSPPAPPAPPPAPDEDRVVVEADVLAAVAAGAGAQ